MSRQVRLRILSPNVGTNDFQNSIGPVYDGLPHLNIIKPTTPNPGSDHYPSDEVEGNDDGGGTQDPYEDPDGSIVDEDRVEIIKLMDRGGTVGSTVEFRAQFRQFVRLELNGIWHRVSDWFNWRHHAKVIKVWERAGRDGQPGHAGLDDDNNGTIDDESEYGNQLADHDDDDKDNDNSASVLPPPGGGYEGHYIDNGSISDSTNIGWE